MNFRRQERVYFYKKRWDLGSGIMKKHYVFILSLLITAGLVYTAFYNDEKWYPKEGRFFSEKNYLNDPDIMRMIEKQLYNVDYAAIVYTKASKVTPNSWFHRVVIGESYVRTHHLIKADVDHTVLGSEHNAITYASTEIGSFSGKIGPAYATLVLLCGDSPDNMYAPENGYEFVASKEQVNYFKQRSKLPVTRKNPNICPK